MNVSLTPELERLIKRKIKSGLYQSASEVVRDALRFFEEHKRDSLTQLERLRREVQLGVDQLDRGEGKTYYGKEGLQKLAREIKQRGRRRLSPRSGASAKKNGRR